MRRSFYICILAMVSISLLLALPVSGFGGITSGNRNSNCNSCHSQDSSINVVMSSSTSQLSPGQQVTVTVACSGTGSNSGRVAVIISTPSGGQPSSSGWTVVRDPGGASSNNCYVDMSGPSTGTYTWSLTAPSIPGSYSLTARAGLIKSGTERYNDAPSPVTFTVSSSTGTPPSVSITSPSNGAVVSGNVTIVSAVTQGTNPIQYVQLQVDGALRGNLTSSPYSFNVDTSNLTDGQHSIAVVAVDDQGLSSTAQVGVTTNNSGNATIPTETENEDLTTEMGLTAAAGALSVIAVFTVLLFLVTGLRRGGGK